MPKLHLKRTPAEEAERQWRKSQKARRRAARDRGSNSHCNSFNLDSDPGHGDSRKRQRTKSQDSGKIWDGPGCTSDEAEYGPQPPKAPRASNSGSSSPDRDAHNYKPDYDAIRAQLEEQRFTEKMSGAFEDDERLDSLEARFNDFAHVPDRWRSGRKKGKGRMEDEEVLDPQYLDDDEYVEWIRAGMWRKKHADEHAEQLRQKALKHARRAQETALKAETARLEKAVEEERRRRKREGEDQRWTEAREFYDTRWKVLLGPTNDPEGLKGFKFEDIPWPVIASQPVVNKRRSSSKAVSISLDDLTAENISAFLLPSSTKPLSAESEKKEKKEKREKLRETILRFHPDKFEGRIMKRVRESHQDKVRQAVGQVTRALNSLMGDGS